MKNRIGTLIILALVLNGCKSGNAPATKEIESHSAGDVVISLANEKGELAQGQSSFVIAFRSASKNEPIDPGKVTVESSMAMPGMVPMTAPIEIEWWTGCAEDRIRSPLWQARCASPLQPWASTCRFWRRAVWCSTEKSGRIRTCRLDPAGFQTPHDWVQNHRSIWERRLDRLGDLLREPDEG